jgi:two-component system chemotaxis sensor kinase CheA
MIIDPNGIARALGGSVTTRMVIEDVTKSSVSRQINPDEQKTSLLVFRAGSMQAKAVPLSLVTRLEEIDVATIELSNGRHMVQYRGQLMPIVNMDDKVRIKGEGAQPLLVFSDGQRSMALVVDAILDIVEEHLDIQVAGTTPGILGSAVIKGHATEIIDVGHFLPIAVEDWFRTKHSHGSAKPPSVLLVDDSPFFRDMLAPVLQVAGFGVTAVTGAQEAMSFLKSGRPFDIVVTDIDMPDIDGFEFAKLMAEDPDLANIPIIALTSMVSADMIERGRDAGFHDFVAKFDRPGLIAALKEQTEFNRAA